MIHEQSGARLGDILVDRNELSKDEMQRVVTAKAEETVYGLFEWKEGSFRFVPGVEPPVNAMHVELHIQQVLLKGARRIDEMEKALQVLKSPGVILHRTDRAVDAPTIASYMGRLLYELIDGRWFHYIGWLLPGDLDPVRRRLADATLTLSRAVR